MALWLCGFALTFLLLPLLEILYHVLGVLALWLCGFASAIVSGLAHACLMCAAAVFATLVHHSGETCHVLGSFVWGLMQSCDLNDEATM